MASENYDDEESRLDIEASDAYLARLLTMTEREALESVSDLLMALARGRGEQLERKKERKRGR